jgi:PAS domain S-box-containing protein
MTSGHGVDASTRSDVGHALDLAEVLDALPSLVGYVDRHGVNRYSNAAVSHWLRRAPEDVEGASVRELLGEEGYLSVASRIEAAQQGKRQEFMRVLPTADGSITYAQTVYVPRFTDGRPDGFYAMSTDVTARVLAERAHVHEAVRSAELAHRTQRAAALSDDVLQQLYAVGLHLDRLARHPELLPEVAGPVLLSLQDTITQLRSSITGVLLGGESATADVVRQLVAGWSERIGADPVILVDARVGELTTEESRQLLTALSEILATASRHAAAALRVEIMVTEGGPAIRVEGHDWPEVARSEFQRTSAVTREDGGRLEIDALHPVVTRVSWSWGGVPER